jgi:glyoxalase family protein
MPYRIEWRVGSDAALDFWSARLGDEGVATDRDERGLHFADPEGLEHTLLVAGAPDAPLVAQAAGVPAEHALQGFAGVRAYADQPDASAPLLEDLGFEASAAASWTLAGAERQGALHYDEPPGEPGMQGAGSIHHIAWSAADDAELAEMRERAAHGGAHPTPIIDRQYFHSVYFREPSGVLFELATRDIGFDVDEPAESLGEALMLPPQYEARRDDIAGRLTPLTNPRSTTAA